VLDAGYLSRDAALRRDCFISLRGDKGLVCGETGSPVAIRDTFATTSLLLLRFDDFYDFCDFFEVMLIAENMLDFLRSRRFCLTKTSF
jgi:hypothetical protein